MLDRDQLDELSRLFAEKLFEKYPEWEAAARHCPEQPLSFYVEWDSPVKGRSIGCTSENGEISVYFGGWHSHYGSFMGLTDAEVVEAALAVIAEIVNDRAVVEAVYRDGEWTRATLRGNSDALWFETLAASGSFEGESLEIRVQSWSGRFDEVKKG